MKFSNPLFNHYSVDRFDILLPHALVHRQVLCNDMGTVTIPTPHFIVHYRESILSASLITLENAAKGTGTKPRRSTMRYNKWLIEYAISAPSRKDTSCLWTKKQIIK